MSIESFEEFIDPGHPLSRNDGQLDGYHGRNGSRIEARRRSHADVSLKNSVKGRDSGRPQRGLRYRLLSTRRMLRHDMAFLKQPNPVIDTLELGTISYILQFKRFGLGVSNKEIWCEAWSSITEQSMMRRRQAT
jgi:DNA polymerase III subunit alpha, Gram-positive type